MCLLALAYEVHPDYPLIVLANRDELYARPTAPAALYTTHPNVYGGRDLDAGGTWMGVAKQGRFATVTNYRDPTIHSDQRASRGHLVDGFLNSTVSPAAYIGSVRLNAKDYNPFNLIIADTNELLCYSSLSDQLTFLIPGIYGLSNCHLDTPWPKVVRARQIVAEAVLAKQLDPEAMIQAMQSPVPYDEKFLPSTGVAPELEQALSSLFIQLSAYGTRSTTLMVRNRLGGVSYWEMTYAADGQPDQMSVVDLIDDDFGLK